jgi:hypothetical protein
MSNVALINEGRPAMVSGGQVMAIVPQNYDEIRWIANAICRAQMAPKGLDTPDKAFVAIVHGLEVGLKPMQALQRIAVVNGRPTIWGDGAIGLVRGSGLCEYVNERIEGEGDKRAAICEAKRKGEAQPVMRKFSVDDAKKANLWGKAGPWSQYPERMLQMRARAFALRDLFADVLGGMHIHEEVADEETVQARIAPPPPPPPPAAAAPQPEEATIEGDYSDTQEQIVWEDEGETIEEMQGRLEREAQVEFRDNGMEGLAVWGSKLGEKELEFGRGLFAKYKAMQAEKDAAEQAGERND